MFELSACTEVLFAEHYKSDADRIRAVSTAGLDAVEFWFCGNKNLADIKTALAETGITVSSIAAEPWGGLVDPDRRPDILGGLVDSCRIAADLGAPNVVVVAGDELRGVDRSTQHASIVETLSAGSLIAADHGVRLVLEPLNTAVDHPGHYLHDTAEGFEIVREVGSPFVRLLYDLYHSVMMAEEPGRVLSGNIGLVAHVQIADAPGRGEPGTGSIDWPAQLTMLRDLGYSGKLGLEYVPQAETTDSLHFIQSLTEE